MIEAADFLVDIGPGAGVHGGQILNACNFKDLKTIDDSLKHRFGIFFKENEIDNMKNIIDRSISNFKKNIFIHQNFYKYDALM